MRYKDIYSSNIDSILIELQNRIIKDVTKDINDKLEFIVLHFSKPKIKGEITKGKIKWRGLKFCTRINGLSNEYWIEQRGKLIGQKIIINAKEIVL